MYIAKKPCNFGGKQRYIGDEIPDELVDPGRAETLVRIGLIEHVPEKPGNTSVEPFDDGGQENPGTDENGEADDVKQPINENQEEPDTGKTAETEKTVSAKKVSAKKGGQK